jgi:sugar lactone lactonase YvrE
MLTPKHLRTILAAAALLSFVASIQVTAQSVSPNLAIPAKTCTEISIFAGNHTAGYSGDGGLATSAELNGPSGLAVGTGVINDVSISGLFIADTFNNRIRLVDFATGNIYTYAGTGVSGYTPNNDHANQTELNLPTGLAVSPEGWLYYADTGNNVIREIGGFQFVTTVAGTPGSFGFSGDNGAATSALLNSPTGISFDDATNGGNGTGNLYIADSSNERVRRVDAATGTIITVVGNGAAGSSGDGGVSSSAELNDPTDVVSDASGNLYIVDTGNSKIRAVTVTANSITGYAGTINTIAGTGTAGSGGNGTDTGTGWNLNFPQGITLNTTLGSIFVADTDNNVITEFGLQASSLVTPFAGNGIAGYSGNGGPAKNAELNQPLGVASDSTGRLFVADNLNNVIRVIQTVPRSTSCE